jgi:hypothetical protein
VFAEASAVRDETLQASSSSKLAQTEICLISRHSCCFTLRTGENERERKGKGTRQVLVHPSWLLPHQQELPHEQEDRESRETARGGVSRSGGEGGKRVRVRVSQKDSRRRRQMMLLK